jgi:hypothetical protein
MKRYDDITLAIARKKLDTAPSSNLIHRPRLGTGGAFQDVFFWDTAFTCLWSKYFIDELPVFTSLDNLYRLADSDGYICRQYLPIGEPKYLRSHPDCYSPPLLSWTELDIYNLHGDRDRLARVYPLLQRFHESFRKMFRAKDGLFICSPMGSGMDNLPRWPRGWTGDKVGQPLMEIDIHPSVPTRKGIVKSRAMVCSWNYQCRWIDASCQAAFDSLCMKRIAEIINDTESAVRYTDEHSELKKLINERCWSDKDAFYFDVTGEQQIRRFHVGAYWALLAEVCPQECLDGFIAHLTDPARFGRMTPVPSISADDPDYHPQGQYWLGSSWAPTTYMTLKGLKAVGRDALARKLGSAFLNTVISVFDETGTLWENYAPETTAPGNQSGPDFVGWTGLATVAVPREIMT